MYNLPEAIRIISIVITPSVCRVSSQKHRIIIHIAGMNDAMELNNLRTFVNVIFFARTRRSAMIPFILNIKLNFK
jgi:hypothetical protein